MSSEAACGAAGGGAGVAGGCLAVWLPSCLWLSDFWLVAGGCLAAGWLSGAVWLEITRPSLTPRRALCDNGDSDEAEAGAEAEAEAEADAEADAQAE